MSHKKAQKSQGEISHKATKARRKIATDFTDFAEKYSHEKAQKTQRVA